MEFARQALAILLVFGLLAGTLWWLRRRNAVRFGAPFVWRGGRSTPKRMEPVERLALSAHHVLHLVRVDGREMLLVVHATGCTVVAESLAEVKS